MKLNDCVMIENTPDGNQRIFCEHCGAHIVIKLPLLVEMWGAIASQFATEHRHCQPATKGGRVVDSIKEEAPATAD